jgi:hypothetical protein
MSGQIPPYGVNFRRESTSYHPTLANRVFVLKRDNEWFIRSDKTSKHWQVFHGAIFDQATPHGRVQPSFSAAMRLLLEGIDEGFYVAKGEVHSFDCGLQGSGLDKKCTCHVDRMTKTS